MVALGQGRFDSGAVQPFATRTRRARVAWSRFHGFHPGPGFEQHATGVAADVAGAAGHEHGAVSHGRIMASGLSRSYTRSTWSRYGSSRGSAGREVGDQHVDLIPRERLRGCPVSELGRIDREDDSLAELASAIFTSASSSVASLAPTSGSTAAALTNKRRRRRSRAGRVARGPTRLPVRGSSSPPVRSAVTARVVLHRTERVGPVGQDGDVARLAEAGGEPLHRRRRVDADRAAGADEVEQLLRDARLGARGAAGIALRTLAVPRPLRHRARVPRCPRRRAGRGRAGSSSR